MAKRTKVNMAEYGELIEAAAIKGFASFTGEDEATIREIINSSTLIIRFKFPGEDLQTEYILAEGKEAFARGGMEAVMNHLRRAKAVKKAKEGEGWERQRSSSAPSADQK